MRRGAARLALLAGLWLVGCAGDLATPGEPLRIFGDLDAAFLNEPYNEPVLVVGGLRPFSFELTEGELPPGLSLQGGSLIGTPTELGSFAFTVTVSDANLSTTFERFSLTVEELPPVELVAFVPETQVQRPVTIRVDAVEARDLQALRTRLGWDPELFTLVPDSVIAARPTLATLVDTSTEGFLQVDLTSLAQPLSGQVRLFSFELAPTRAAYLEVDAATEFLSAGRRHDFARARAGTPDVEEGDGDEDLPDEDLPGEDGSSGVDGSSGSETEQ